MKTILRKKTKNESIKNATLEDIYREKMTKINNNSDLQDILQEAMIKLLESKQNNEISIEHAINRACYGIRVDRYRRESIINRYLELEKSVNNGDCIDYNDNRDVLNHVINKLNDAQYDLFKMYHVDGLSQIEISVKTGKDQGTISRKLKALNNALHSLNIRSLYNTRFVDPNHHDFKFPHGREYNPAFYEDDAISVKDITNKTCYVYKHDVSEDCTPVKKITPIEYYKYKDIDFNPVKKDVYKNSVGLFYTNQKIFIDQNNTTKLWAGSLKTHASLNWYSFYINDMSRFFKSYNQITKNQGRLEAL